MLSCSPEQVVPAVDSGVGFIDSGGTPAASQSSSSRDYVDADSADADSDLAETGTTTSAVAPVDASDAANEAIDADDKDGAAELSDANSGDAVRVCSADPAEGVTWQCSDASLCQAVALEDAGCLVPWGCGDLDSAVQTACSSGYQNLSRADACGRVVLQTATGPGVPIRAFYDPKSGQLLGTWLLQSDVIDQPGNERCSGSIPFGCLDWVPPSGEKLCADAGPLGLGTDADADADASD